MPGPVQPPPNYPPQQPYSQPHPVSQTMDSLHYQQQNPYSAAPPSTNHFAPNLPGLANSYPRMPNPISMGQTPVGQMPPAMNVPVQPPVDMTQSMSLIQGGYRYSLIVVQQPRRARMCGFGDKDRRPITPPPCVRLVVTEVATGKEVDSSELDPSFFVLNVDLWDESGTREVNLVKHSNTTPAVSISAASTCGYPPPPERPYLGLLNPPEYAAYMRSLGHMPPAPMGGYADPYSAVPQMSPGGTPGYMVAAQQPVNIIPNHQQGMYTRNLIGSLTVNAAKLQDDKGEPGLWFVLQDLSVRTEGLFRLRMRFIDVSDPNVEGPNKQLNTEHAPVLASCFSDSFQVYSAKKFPGVVESTPLSRAFAAQGIKIPIRKDGPKLPNQEEYDADDK